MVKVRNKTIACSKSCSQKVIQLKVELVETNINVQKQMVIGIQARLNANKRIFNWPRTNWLVGRHARESARPPAFYRTYYNWISLRATATATAGEREKVRESECELEWKR